MPQLSRHPSGQPCRHHLSQLVEQGVAACLGGLLLLLLGTLLLSVPLPLPAKPVTMISVCGAICVSRRVCHDVCVTTCVSRRVCHDVCVTTCVNVAAELPHTPPGA
jgi:hypothetical protein